MKTKFFRTFKVAVCGCGHSWTTEAKSFRCAACERKRLKMKKENLPSMSERTEIGPETTVRSFPDSIKDHIKHKVIVHTYLAIKNPFKK